MCYQNCRYEYGSGETMGECSLKSGEKPPIDAMCSIADLDDEIIVLRELVRDMWHNGMCECDKRHDCTTCEYGYLDRMRELGIEVD